MTDIVERLNKVATADAKYFLRDVPPDELETLSQLARDAIAEIMRLRTLTQEMQSIMGVAALGPSFAEIREQAKAQDRVDTETRR